MGEVESDHFAGQIRDFVVPDLDLGKELQLLEFVYATDYIVIVDVSIVNLCFNGLLSDDSPLDAHLSAVVAGDDLLGVLVLPHRHLSILNELDLFSQLENGS